MPRSREKYSKTRSRPRQDCAYSPTGSGASSSVAPADDGADQRRRRCRWRRPRCARRRSAAPPARARSCSGPRSGRGGRWSRTCGRPGRGRSRRAGGGRPATGRAGRRASARRRRARGPWPRPASEKRDTASTRRWTPAASNGAPDAPGERGAHLAPRAQHEDVARSACARRPRPRARDGRAAPRAAPLSIAGGGRCRAGRHGRAHRMRDGSGEGNVAWHREVQKWRVPRLVRGGGGHAPPRTGQNVARKPMRKTLPGENPSTLLIVSGPQHRGGAVVRVAVDEEAVELGEAVAVAGEELRDG